MTEFRRNVIDSKYRTSGSISNADFYVELPNMVNVRVSSLHRQRKLVAYLADNSTGRERPVLSTGVASWYFRGNY